MLLSSEYKLTNRIYALQQSGRLRMGEEWGKREGKRLRVGKAGGKD